MATGEARAGFRGLLVKRFEAKLKLWRYREIKMSLTNTGRTERARRVGASLRLDN